MRTFLQLAKCYESDAINSLDARLIASSQMLTPFISLEHARRTCLNTPYPTAWNVTPDSKIYTNNAIIDCIAFIKSFPGSITSYCIGKPHLDDAIATLSRVIDG